MQFWIQFWILLRYFQTCLHNLKLWFWPVVFFERISKFYRFGRSANFVSLLHTSSRTQRGIISLSVRSQNKVRRCWLLQPFLDLSVVICHPILDVAANKVIPDFQEIAADGSHDMIETVSIENLPGGAVAVQFRFLVEGSFLRTCDLDGLFCVNDFGMFPPAIARLLLHSKVQPVSYIYYRTGLLLVL